MTEPLTLLSAFMIGLLGSTHCIGMCGGIANALAFSNASSTKNRLFYPLFYNIGRILSYAIIGIIAGSLGFTINQLLGPQGGVILRTITGLIMIALGLYLAGWWLGLRYLEQVGAKVWLKISPLTRKLLPINSTRQALNLGLLWGFLPCGLVYSTIALATFSGQWYQGGLLMLSFGLGTMPTMLVISSTSQQLSTFITKKKIRMIAGILVILFGLWTITPLYFLHSHNHATNKSYYSHQH